jgi:branched-subunit amino acid transport protein
VSWAAIIALALGTFALKASGPVLLGDRTLPPLASRLAELLPAALLAALVAVNVVGGDRQLVADARLAGLAAALVAVRLKASFIVVVLAACGATALARAVGS